MVDGGKGNTNSQELPAPVEDDSASMRSPEVPWSTFSRSQKRLIIGLAAVGGFFSPLSSSIYFPAIQTIANDYHRSIGDINLTVTVFMIFQGVVPALFTDLAESVGKRPVYLITFTIYVAANIGLALQNSYGALLALRCLQSSGSSVTAALATSTASDIAKGSERGQYVGATLAGLLVAPAIGPVAGGLLAGYLGWRAIFWFLTICASMFLLVYFTFGLESARSIVGDGSLPPPRLNQSMLQLLESTKQHEYSELDSETTKPKWRIPNPTKTFLIFKEKDLGCVLLYSSLLNAALYQMMASTSIIFAEKYGYNDTIVGVCFIPIGVGTSLGSIGGGKILDLALKRFARRRTFDVDRNDHSEEDLSFPWAQARLMVMIPCATMAAVMITCYGWIIDARVTVAVPLIFQFLFSFFSTMASNSTGVILVDNYPDRSATASAANNIARCLVGAGATAVIQPMLDAMGRGWCFTFVGLVLVLFQVLLWPVWRYGSTWRRERILKELDRQDA